MVGRPYFKTFCFANRRERICKYNWVADYYLKVNPLVDVLLETITLWVLTPQADREAWVDAARRYIGRHKPWYLMGISPHDNWRGHLFMWQKHWEIDSLNASCIYCSLLRTLSVFEEHRQCTYLVFLQFSLFYNGACVLTAWSDRCDIIPASNIICPH